MFYGWNLRIFLFLNTHANTQRIIVFFCLFEMDSFFCLLDQYQSPPPPPPFIDQCCSISIRLLVWKLFYPSIDQSINQSIDHNRKIDWNELGVLIFVDTLLPTYRYLFLLAIIMLFKCLKFLIFDFWFFKNKNQKIQKISIWFFSLKMNRCCWLLIEMKIRAMKAWTTSNCFTFFSTTVTVCCCCCC